MPVLTHGGDIYSAREKGLEHILDFSANINPLGLPRQVQLAAERSVRDCVHYPDPLCRALAEKIARHEQVKQGVDYLRKRCGRCPVSPCLCPQAAQGFAIVANLFGI